MVFRGSSNTETIFFHTAGDCDDVHWIDMTIYPGSSSFEVVCCCGEGWKYEFEYTKSDYDRIKFLVMETIFTCETVEEVVETLTEVFDDGFSDIVIVPVQDRRTNKNYN